MIDGLDVRLETGEKWQNPVLTQDIETDSLQFSRDWYHTWRWLASRINLTGLRVQTWEDCCFETRRDGCTEYREVCWNMYYLTIRSAFLFFHHSSLSSLPESPTIARVRKPRATNLENRSVVVRCCCEEKKKKHWSVDNLRSGNLQSQNPNSQNIPLFIFLHPLLQHTTTITF